MSTLTYVTTKVNTKFSGSLCTKYEYLFHLPIDCLDIPAIFAIKNIQNLHKIIIIQNYFF